MVAKLKNCRLVDQSDKKLIEADVEIRYTVKRGNFVQDVYEERVDKEHISNEIDGHGNGLKIKIYMLNAGADDEMDSEYISENKLVFKDSNKKEFHDIEVRLFSKPTPVRLYLKEVQNYKLHEIEYTNEELRIYFKCFDD